MHARGLLIALFCGQQLPDDPEDILAFAADSLDWYALEGYGIGDVEIEDDENINACCDGYIVGPDARFSFSDGTYIKPIDEAIKDIVDSGVGVGVVVCNEYNGWMEGGLDFIEGDEMELVERAADELKRYYIRELESDDWTVVGVLFDARVW